MLEFLLTWGVLGLLTMLAFVYAIVASMIGSWRPRRVLAALFGPGWSDE